MHWPILNNLSSTSLRQLSAGPGPYVLKNMLYYMNQSDIYRFSTGSPLFFKWRTECVWVLHFKTLRIYISYHFMIYTVYICLKLHCPPEATLHNRSFLWVKLHSYQNVLTDSDQMTNTPNFLSPPSPPNWLPHPKCGLIGRSFNSVNSQWPFIFQLNQPQLWADELTTKNNWGPKFSLSLNSSAVMKLPFCLLKSVPKMILCWSFNVPFCGCKCC